MSGPFSVGYANCWPEVMEWDGANEQDICDWATAAQPPDGIYTWADYSVVTVTSSQLTLTGAGPLGSVKTVVVPLNGWVRMAAGILNVLLDKDQFWVSDSYGRPVSASDIESP